MAHTLVVVASVEYRQVVAWSVVDTLAAAGQRFVVAGSVVGSYTSEGAYR